MDNLYVNTRSSIKITGTKTIYFDPLDIAGTPHDADIVFMESFHFKRRIMRELSTRESPLII